MRRQQQSHPTISLPPPVKAPLSYEEWEASAPLSDIQAQSVNQVKRSCQARRLPAKFANSSDVPSRPATPVSRGVASPILRAGSPATTAARTQHPLQPLHPISTPQEFHDWFAVIEKSISHSQESHFRAHLETVSVHLNNCDALHRQTLDVRTDVSTMIEEWNGVEEGGQNLQGACERMLEERDRLMRVSDEIEERLEYFQELEVATRMLSHPGDDLVLQDDFLYMIERLDVCIDYIENHRDFRESQLYLMRYQHCLTRAMTLVKMHFVNALKISTSEIQRRLNDKDVSNATETLLLYPKFQSASKSLRPLLFELETRAIKRPDELNALLNECHSAYFGARKQLITGRLMQEIQRVIKGSEGKSTGKGGAVNVDLVELTRAGCSYLKQICVDEFSLYRAFFDSGEDRLYRFLEGLCDYLYDDLRPRILHEPKLSVLCQVCTVIQALMVLDRSGDYDDQSSTNSDESDPDSASAQYVHQPLTATSLRTVKSAHENSVLRRDGLRSAAERHKLRHLHVGNLLEMVLQDAQTRLVFKAQAIIQSDIRYYVAREGDLSYPEKLTAPTNDSLTVAEDSPLSRIPSLARQGTWYPTLRKTFWILSQLLDFIKPAVFEDIAYEAITLCRDSLLSASEALSAKGKGIDGHFNTTDSLLFYLRHLLVLKEIATYLGLDAQKERGMDFGVTDAFASMVSNPNAFLNQGLARLRLPKVVENIADARTELDGGLRNTCDAIISQCVVASTAALQVAPEATNAERRAAHQAFMSAAEKFIPYWLDRLKLYLDNDDKIINALVVPMEARVLGMYDDYQGRGGSEPDWGADGSVRGFFARLRDGPIKHP